MKIGSAVNIGLNVVNLGWIIYGDREFKKSMKYQNIYAFGMIAVCVAVSVANTVWIIKKVEES